MLSLPFFSEHPDLLAMLLTDRIDNSSIVDKNCSPKEQANSPAFIKKIQPRTNKSTSKKRARTKAQAEVFTPAWLCNQQNNLTDSRWFDSNSPFNEETFQGWRTRQKKILFPKGKNWLDYIQTTRLEICCGEAPYLTSRYDATTGEIIPVNERIGLLDRKLRVVSENTETHNDWIEYATQAVKSIFGYEKSGDSLLIARINLFLSFSEYYQYKFKKDPAPKSLKKIAEVISWNLWQMDSMSEESINLAIIMDWKENKKIFFKSLLH